MSFTPLQRIFREGTLFSGLFDKSKFIPTDTPKSADFQKLEIAVTSTDKINTYDLVFNIQMPSLANTPIFGYTKNKDAVDYYCNNKIHIRLYFKDPNIFDTESSPVCIITPQIFKGKTTSKTDGIYFSTVSDVREKVEAAVTDAIIEGYPYQLEKDLTLKGGIQTENKDRRGPFAKSNEGIDAGNIKEKLKGKTFGIGTDYLKKLVKYTGEKLEAGSENSPFKVYNTRYDKKKFVENEGLVATSDHMNTEEKKRFFDKDFQHFIQFDFNLNDYTVEKDDKGNITRIIKKTNDTGEQDVTDPSLANSDTDESLVMLLNKNQWFSVVFQNINIPFDIKQIPEKMVKLEFQIDNTTPPDAIGDANLFYRNFFCEYLNMSLKLYNLLPITVHDVMFGYEDMVRAIKNGSPKYFSKIAQLNYLARRVIYYYLKEINDTENQRYTSFYKQMMSSIQQAKTKTEEIIKGSSLTKTGLMTELKSSVEKANSEIIEFSNFFKRNNIKSFRTIFLQALMVGTSIKGLSKLTQEDIIKILAKIKNFKELAKPGPTSFSTGNSLPIAVNKKGKVTESFTVNPGGLKTITTGAEGGNMTEYQTGGDSVLEYQTGGDSVLEYQTGGDSVLEYQTGGSIMLQSEDYNLMVPMDIHTPGTGINDMVVRIHKLHLEQALEEGETKQMDNQTSVDIQVGDAIRFVYNDNIIHAIVCGFKPGKDLNDDGTDRRMEIMKFRTEYMTISGTFESQDLKMSPPRFLSLTNMRGIKFLPFKYNDENYSYAPYDTSVLQSRNESVIRGLNGKFVFSCKDEKIPILPNGYKLPFIGRFKEGVKNILSKIPFSTEVDIGNDSSFPQYSLPSYMTLEKVLVPPNFSEVIQKIKDFRGDNPDSILKDLIKIMETNGINDSNDCKKTSGKIEASNIATRKKYYQAECDRIRKLFYSQNFVKDGKIINMEGAVQFIKNLYNQQIKPGVFVDSNGNSMRISTQLAFALDLIPNNPKLNMKILLKALSQPDVPTIIDRKKNLSKKLLDSENTEMAAAKEELFDNEGGGIQYGGAADADVEKAEKIIKDTVNLLRAQNFINDETKDKYVADLGSARLIYNPNEQEPTPTTSSTSLVKSGVGPGTGVGYGRGVGSNFFANMFNKGSMGSSSSSGMGSDSCGNNTSIVCNGEDLVVTVTLKLNELIASCMNPQMIQDYGSHPDNFKKIMNGEESGDGASVDVKPAAKANVQNDGTEPSKSGVEVKVQNDGTKSGKTGIESSNTGAEVKVQKDDTGSMKSATESTLSKSTDNAQSSQSATESTLSNPTDNAQSSQPAGPTQPVDFAPPQSTAAASSQPGAAGTDSSQPADVANAKSGAQPSKSGADTEVKAAAPVSPETTKLIEDTKTLLLALRALVDSRTKTEDGMISTANTQIKESAAKYIKKETNQDTLSEIGKVSLSEKDDATTKLSGIIETNYKTFIDTVMPIVKKTFTKLVETLNQQLKDNKTKINEFVANLKKIDEYLKDPKNTTSPSLGETRKFYDDANTFIVEENDMVKYANTPPTIEDAVNDKDIKMHIISTVIRALEKSTDNENVKTLLKNFKHPGEFEVEAGGNNNDNNNNNNNNKTKNNRKSNKNKTKKRKIKKSSNRKFKFAKVKKV